MSSPAEGLQEDWLMDFSDIYVGLLDIQDGGP